MTEITSVTSLAYYNENDPKAAAWLRELINRGLIAPGDVDERSIEDVCPNDLAPYRQCHFFAGVGVWSYALRQAGWPDDRAVWTGSAPCFAAGTFVLTSKGQVPIEKVEIGDLVLTHQGRFMPVVSVMKSIQPTVIVKGQGSSGIETTAEHPFLARRTYKDYKRASLTYDKIIMSDPEWINACDLRTNACRWAMPIVFDSTEMPAIEKQNWSGVEANVPHDMQSNAFARFLGYWVGDGWTTNRSKKPNLIVLCGGHEDAELLLEIAEGTGLSGSKSTERTGARLRIGSKRIFSIIRGTVGGKLVFATTCRIPKCQSYY